MTFYDGAQIPPSYCAGLSVPEREIPTGVVPDIIAVHVVRCAHSQ